MIIITELDEKCKIDLESIPIYEDGKSEYVEPNRPWQKHVPENIPKALNYPEVKNLACILDNAANEFPYNMAIYDMDRDEKYTYIELKDLVDRCARAFYDLGIKKGDGIGLYTSNCPEFYIILFACLKLGAILVPINPLLKHREISHIVRDSGIIKLMISHKKLWRQVKKVHRKMPFEKIAIIDETRDEREGTLNFEKLIESAEPEAPEVEIDIKEDIAFLMYTGGTTGLPKGVMLTHFNMMANALQSSLRIKPFEEGLEIRGKWANLAILPLCHIYGLLMACNTVANGYMNITLLFDPVKVMKAIDKFEIQVFSGIPTMYTFIANNPKFKEYDLSSLELVTSAAAALAPSITNKWKETQDVIPIQGYGLTEACPSTHLQPRFWMKPKGDSIGIPLADTDAKIVNPETLEDVPAGERGELIICGPQIMKGYWKKPSRTEAVLIKRDGKTWLRTGDVAKMDEDGYFYIVGRTKEMIKYKGYRILPFEVEKTLYEHPAIYECAVIGIPDDEVGERIKAFCSIKPEYKDKVTEEDIIEWAKEEMAGYKWPRMVEFVQTIPKTAVGKVFRRELMEKEMKKQKEEE
ncbi:MAG: AMP-binding protein [Candidatus Lokiarchaeota archaeon]|nr:AMP-binding protein [Candidatus Lokiarchaeota archaeon]